jgi:UDP-N-acetylglucosamine 2-epimerase (non-hydrolysing)
MDLKKVLIVFGTRPEAIKMAPLVKEFENNNNFISKVCVTAQHREMLDQVLDYFDINPDFDLNIMSKNQTLYDVTAKIISEMRIALENFKPEYVFIHGDTTTSMASGIAAFYFGAKICHIEAGLRTFNKLSPYPEEMNRQIVGRLADYHFSPTSISKFNLLKENIDNDKIYITGNTVVDSLMHTLKRVNKNPSEIISSLSKKIRSKDVILVTAHRRENHGDGFIKICNAIKQIAKENENVLIVYPVHLNPNVQDPVNKLLSNVKNILLIEPLSYPDFVWMMNKSKLIITDSGGIQEEAPSLGKPVILLRNNSERPEAIDSGTVLLVGNNPELIVNKTNDLLRNKIKYNKMSSLTNPYGDGNASKRIVKIIEKL